MVGVQDAVVCPRYRGYWYDFDLRTMEYTKLTKCRCDIEQDVATELLKERSLEGFKLYIEYNKETVK